MPFSKTDRLSKGQSVTASHRCKALALPSDGVPTAERCDACGILALMKAMKADHGTAGCPEKALYCKIVDDKFTTQPLHKGGVLEEMRYHWHTARSCPRRVWVGREAAAGGGR